MVNNPPALSSEIYSDRLIDRLSYAHDASLYRVVPEAVVRPTDANDVIELLKYGNETIFILDSESGSPRYFSRNLMCPDSGISYPKPEPNTFS